MMAAIDKADDRLARVFDVRRATVKRERANPPPMIKKVDFCAAGATPAALPTVGRIDRRRRRSPWRGA